MSFAESFVRVLDENELNHSEIMRTDDSDYVRFGMRGGKYECGGCRIFPG